MKSIVVKSPAKINLILRVFNRKRQNLHCIQSLMQTISLSDEITIKKTEKSIKVEVKGNIKIPFHSNSVYKAAKLFFEETKINGGVNIILKKNIPIGAGLGGGSSNAASTLLALHKLFDVPIKHDKLSKLALKLGSDVPFFLKGGTALVEGVGEKVKQLPLLKSLWLVLVKPDFSVATAWAYRALDSHRKKHGLQLTRGHNCIRIFLDLVNTNKIENLVPCIHNDFEDVVAKHYPVIRKIQAKLKEADASYTAMTGSGSTIFAVESSKEKGEMIYKEMCKTMDGCTIHLAHAIKPAGAFAGRVHLQRR